MSKINKVDKRTDYKTFIEFCNEPLTEKQIKILLNIRYINKVCNFINLMLNSGDNTSFTKICELNDGLKIKYLLINNYFNNKYYELDRKLKIWGETHNNIDWITYKLI